MLLLIIVKKLEIKMYLKKFTIVCLLLSSFALRAQNINKDEAKSNINSVATGLAHLVNVLPTVSINGKQPYCVLNSNWEGTIFFPAGNPTFYSGWGVTFRVRADISGKYSIQIMKEPASPWNPFPGDRTIAYNESNYYAIAQATTQDYVISTAVPSYTDAPATQMQLEIQEYGYFSDTPIRDYYYTLRTDGNSPSSSVNPFSSNSQTANTINVSWLGSDGNSATSSGLQKYDIQVRVDNGPWQDWLVGTTSPSATYPTAGFNCTAGHTYYFQSRAYDNVGNIETYPGGSGDSGAWVTINSSISVGTNPSGRTFAVDGTSYSTTQTFSWTPGSSHTISTTSPQSGTTGTQYGFSSWSDGGSMSHTISTPSSSTTYTTNFTTQYYITMNAGTGGMVIPSSGWYNSGQSVSINATPNSGYTFGSWSGSGSGSYSGTTKSTSVTMNGPITQTANFTVIPPTQYSVSLSSNPSNGGTTSGGGTYNSGSSVTVTATPNSGYTFTNWTENGVQVSTSSSYTFLISSNKTLVANFTVIPPTQIGTVTIVSPNGGESWTAGTSNNISWTASGNLDSGVDLQYTTNNGVNWTYIASPNKASSPYSWSVPSGINSSQCRVKILGYYNGANVNDESNNNFSIIPASSSAIKLITTYTTITKGAEFTVELKVGDPTSVNDLYGISFKLSSNNSNCTYVDGSAENGGFLGSSVLFFPQKVDNQTVDIAVTKTSAPGVSGSGIVARTKFKLSNTVTTGETITLSLNSITATNSLGNIIIMSSSPLNLTVGDNLVNVWPGDTNNDGIVDGRDILPIGQYYGQSGPAPNNSGTQWQAYPRQPWTSDGSTPKRVFADANGDGTISASDVLPVGSNYNKTHSISGLVTKNNLEGYEKLEKQSLSNASIKLIGPSKVKANTSFTINVTVGNPVAVSDLYGISFKINSSAATCTYVDNSASEGTFLGSGVLKFFQPVDNQTVDAAVTKTYPPGVNGSGTIASFDFRSSVDQTVNFSLQNVTATDSQGNTILFDVIPISILVDVKENILLPTEFSLTQNYPNPFNPTTTISFEISHQSYITLKVYNVLGKEVATLLNGEKSAGKYNVEFNAGGLASGVYFYKLQAGSFVQTKKLILMK